MALLTAPSATGDTAKQTEAMKGMGIEKTDTKAEQKKKEEDEKRRQSKNLQ